jgi:hypothetical protein
MRLHKDVFATKWVVSITTRMMGMCEEGFVIPIIAMFYNDAASVDILTSKRSMRTQSDAFNQHAAALKQLHWYSLVSLVTGYIKLFWNRLVLRFSVWRQQPLAEAVDRCIESPEFEFLQYLHKLTERMDAWRSFRDKHLPPDQLPATFRLVKGQYDPPQAEYSYLVEVQQLADAYIPKEMQNTMFALMLAEKLTRARSVVPSHREYVNSHCRLLFCLNLSFSVTIHDFKTCFAILPLGFPTSVLFTSVY